MVQPGRWSPEAAHWEWRARQLETALQQAWGWHESFTEHDLEAEPHRADKPGDNDGDHGLEGIALRLLDALAPAPQMLKVRAQLLAILFLDPERGQDGCDGAENHRV